MTDQTAVAAYFRAVGPDIIEAAEDATEWPRDCAVCHFERGTTEPAADRPAAITHRRTKHPWLDKGLAAARAPKPSRKSGEGWRRFRS